MSEPTGRVTLAVDLGGTNMRVAVVADDGSIIDRDHAPTPHEAETIDAFVDLIVGLRSRHPAVEHAVVAVPGRVDHQAGTLLHAPHLPASWLTQISRDALGAALELPVVLANDADVAAVGEAWFGAGQGHADVVYVTISTGVGAGIIVGGHVVLPHYSGGEIGHTVIDRRAAADGEPATFEQLGSGTAIARQARERGLDVGAKDLVALVATDERARSVWGDAMFAAGIGFANLVHLVAPTIVIIGGGVGRNGELVLAPVRAAIERFGPKGTPPEVVTAALGDDSGLIGAAAWRRATER